MSLETIATIACCEGQLVKLAHASDTVHTQMALNVFLPPNYAPNARVPALVYLSGLTCTPQNASEKGGLFAHAARLGLAIVLPDTSPRGANVEGEDESWDFGTGAGFYLNATKDPWNVNYNMYDYVTRELIDLIGNFFTGIDTQRLGVLGHSMGGLGALVVHMRNPGLFKTCSAFAPICSPTSCPWGQKALGGYLVSQDEWAQYDPCALVKTTAAKGPILIHYGTADNFLSQLQPDALVAAAKGTPLDGKILLNAVQGYDHSYYFVSTFVGPHLDFHHQQL